MKNRSDQFPQAAIKAIADPGLADALSRTRDGLVGKRSRALEAAPQFAAMRSAASAVRDYSLKHLAHWLKQFEQRFIDNGGRIHWASDAQHACDIVAELIQARGHRQVIKGKSMVSEEIGLNQHLMDLNLEVLETDLGEYIIQLAGETPSHIIAPAVHKTREDVDALFAHHHQREKSDSVDISALVQEARSRLREAYHRADVGITGANALVAESGSLVLVTNEGNGDLCAAMPNHHIAITGIEKVVPTLDDAGALLRVLGRSATGQAMSAYTTLFQGPLSPQHSLDLVLVDNGRSDIWASSYRDILKCIRCGACLNHCPVYGKVGGHAYGWVYTGPMGAVLTPLLSDFAQSGQLAAASTLCGRCNEVCPVDIPLPELLRQVRNDENLAKGEGSQGRGWMKWWARVAQRPGLHRMLLEVLRRGLRVSSGPWVTRVPGSKAWRRGRPLARPAGPTKPRGGKG